MVARIMPKVLYAEVYHSSELSANKKGFISP